MRLLQGDCIELMHTIPDKSVDMVLCDLPYGTTRCKWDSVIPFAPLWEQYDRICKGPIVLTAAQPFTTALIASNMRRFKYTWVWEKNRSTGFANAKKQPMRRFEDIAVFYDRQPTYNPQGTKKLDRPRELRAQVGEFMGKTGFRDRYVRTECNYPTNILAIACERGLHPTQKPAALMEYLIRTYTNEGDTVLDNCMGSGTTGVACVNTNRHFIGIEKDPKYFGIAEGRILETVAKVEQEK